MDDRKIIIIGDIGGGIELLKLVINESRENGFRVKFIDKNDTDEIKRLGLTGSIDPNNPVTEIKEFKMNIGNYHKACRQAPKKKKGHERPYRFHR